jgi:hypothetical protein
LIKLQDIAILIAHSRLSPVNIHIFMPAFLKASIVKSTPSYILSSTAVTPNSIKSYSKIFCSSSILFSLFSFICSASSNYFAQLKN